MAEDSQTSQTLPSNSVPPSPSNPTPAEESAGKSQALNIPGIQSSPNVAHQMLPTMHTTLVHGLASSQNLEQNDHGQGLYAVPQSPYMGTMAAFPPGMLIPLTYKIPTRPNNTGAVGEEQGQEAARPQHGPHRQVVVRRFQFAVQLDLTLILKLLAVVFLFSQDGSKQKLVLLVFFASLVYLFQTGVLPPLMRWLRRGGVPPQQRPPAPLENAPPNGHNDRNDPRREGNAGVGDQNQSGETEGAPAVDENRAEAEQANGINWWGVLREIQIFVVGFVTSLLPGFHHND